MYQKCKFLMLFFTFHFCFSKSTFTGSNHIPSNLSVLYTKSVSLPVTPAPCMDTVLSFLLTYSHYQIKNKQNKQTSVRFFKKKYSLQITAILEVKREKTCY